MNSLKKIEELYATVGRKVVIIPVEFNEVNLVPLLCSIDGKEPFVLGTIDSTIGEEAFLCEVLSKINQVLLFQRLSE